MTHYTTVFLGVLLAAVYASAADPPIGEVQERWLLEAGYTKDAENNWVKDVNGVMMRAMIVCENPDGTMCLALRPGEEALPASRGDAAATGSRRTNPDDSWFVGEGFTRTPEGTWYRLTQNEIGRRRVQTYYAYRPNGVIEGGILRRGEPLPWP